LAQVAQAALKSRKPWPEPVETANAATGVLCVPREFRSLLVAAGSLCTDSWWQTHATMSFTVIASAPEVAALAVSTRCSRRRL